VLYLGRKGRVIDTLRKNFPGDWSYEPGNYQWVRSDGVTARKEAHYSPRFDSDDGDEAFSTYIRLSKPYDDCFYWSN
jgi:hypothetical protein